MSKTSHELHDVQTAALGVALTNKKQGSKNYEQYKQNLIDQLQKSGEEIVGEPRPFYKKGVSNPAGYVIETKNEVLVCYHGTQFGQIFGSGAKEIAHDLDISRAKMNFAGQEVSVHSGFKAEFEASKDSLHEALQQTAFKTKGVHLAGHSLGAAVAQIAALDLVTNHGTDVKKVTTFGGPRVFTQDASELYNDKGLGDVTLRVKQDKDPVPRLVPRGMYHHTGKKIKLQSSKGIHSGGVYRDIASKIKEEDIRNASPSDKPTASFSFTEIYLKPIMKMTKEMFANLTKNISAKFNKSIVGSLVDKMKENFKKTANKTPTSDTPYNRASINKESLHEI